MKKYFVALVVVLLSVGAASAQDLASVTEAYNNAATLLNDGNKEAAVEAFQAVLTQAAALGDEGAEIANNCKGVIPDLLLSIGKGKANEKATDAAIEFFQKAAAVAAEYGNDEVAVEAKDLIPQVLLQAATTLLNAKDYAAAAAAYQKVIDVDPENGMAFLRMGMAYASAGDQDAAVAALESAVQFGQEANAKKQLSNIFLKVAAAAQKAKDNQGALEAAQKSVEYLDNATGQKLIGITALALKQNAVAAEGFEAYLAQTPDAKDKVQITYQLATALLGAGQNDKACGYFKQIADDAQFGEAAKYQITVLKCN